MLFHVKQFQFDFAVHLNNMDGARKPKKIFTVSRETVSLSIEKNLTTINLYNLITLKKSLFNYPKSFKFYFNGHNDFFKFYKNLSNNELQFNKCRLASIKFYGRRNKFA